MLYCCADGVLLLPIFVVVVLVCSSCDFVVLLCCFVGVLMLHWCVDGVFCCVFAVLLC